MAKIVSIHSFRGGTGKSNTTANLAALLAADGHRVGVIDTDIQSPGIHVIFALETEKVEFALNDYLWGRCAVEQAAADVTEAAIGPTRPEDDRPRLFLIPSSIRTGDIARILREGYDVARLNEGFERLIEALRLDFLLIDTHPGVNEETLLSIAVSDLFLLILRPDKQDFQGTAVTLELARRLDVNEVGVIVNKVPASMDAELVRRQIEAAYHAPILGLLPLCDEMAQLASHGLFVNRFPGHPLTRQLKRIAEHVLR